MGDVKGRWFSHFVGFVLFALLSAVAHGASKAPGGWEIKGTALVSYTVPGDIQVYQRANTAIAVVAKVYSAELQRDGKTRTIAPDSTILLSHWVINKGNVETVFDFVAHSESGEGDDGIIIDSDDVKIYHDVKGDGRIGVEDPELELTTGVTVSPGQAQAILIQVKIPSDDKKKTKIVLTATAREGKPFAVETGESDTSRNTSSLEIDVAAFGVNIVKTLVSHTVAIGDGVGKVRYKVRIDFTGTPITNELKIFELFPSWMKKDGHITNIRNVTSDDRLTFTNNDRDRPAAADDPLKDDNDFGTATHNIGMVATLPGGNVSDKPLVYEVDVAYNGDKNEFLESYLLRSRTFLYQGSTFIADSNDIYTLLEPYQAFTVKGYSASKIGEGNYDGTIHEVESATPGGMAIFTAQIANIGIIADEYALEVSDSTYPEGTQFYFAQSAAEDADAFPDPGVTTSVNSKETLNIFIQARLPMAVKNYNPKGYTAQIQVRSEAERYTTRVVTIKLSELKRPLVDLSYAPKSDKADEGDSNKYSDFVESSENSVNGRNGKKVYINVHVHNQSDVKQRYYLHAYDDDQGVNSIKQDGRPYYTTNSILKWDHSFGLTTRSLPMNSVTVAARSMTKVVLRINVPDDVESKAYPITIIAGDVITANDTEGTNDALKFIANIRYVSEVDFTPKLQSESADAGGTAIYSFVLANKGAEAYRMLIDIESQWSSRLLDILSLKGENQASVETVNDKKIVTLQSHDSVAIRIEVAPKSFRLLGERDVLTLSAQAVDDNNNPLVRPPKQIAKAITTLTRGNLHFKKFVSTKSNPEESDFKSSIDNVSRGMTLVWKGVVTNQGPTTATGCSC